MIKVGLTGSIGMGKTTTAQMFRNEGIAVYDADAAVHELYAGVAAPLIEEAFTGTTSVEKSGARIVNRTKLGEYVIGSSDNMKKLEAIIHPLVHEKEYAFLEAARARGDKMVILDIPLLFETGGENRVDKIIVVTASREEQTKRVLSRDGMTQEKFEAILAKQLPDHEKRKRADIIIDTGEGLQATRKLVHEIIVSII